MSHDHLARDNKRDEILRYAAGLIEATHVI